jgi:molybdenum cofactor cytidylyltransferase
MRNLRIGGLLLAAGKSERMGSPKSLLQVYGRTFLEQIVKEAAASRLQGLKVVLGHEADNIRAQLPTLPVEFILNPEYPSGQLSSFIRGIQAWESEHLDGLMLFLVDHPLITRDIINQLVIVFQKEGNSIVIPTYKGKRGHPVIFSRKLFSEILQTPLEQGASAVVRAHSESVRHLESLSADILVDIDTPEAYQQYIVDAGLQSARGTN